MASFQPWANPDPQSVAGLNAAMVYGENLQFTAGLNHQVALGSNLQLCINPGVLFDLLNVPGSSTLAGLWGSGPGGNMQFTIGSSANVTWGRQFDIHMGPEKIELNLDQQTAFGVAACSLLGAAALAYSIGYGLCDDEDGRASMVILFQVLTDALLAALMTQVMFTRKTSAALTDGMRTLYGAPTSDHSFSLEDFVNGLSGAGIIAAVVAPPVAIAIEEGHFQGQTQDSI